jgi:hypothetical protein
MEHKTALRATPSGQLSVLDILAREGSRYPSVTLRRLLRRHPALRERLSTCQFPGQGQRGTPTISPSELGFLLALLGGGHPPGLRLIRGGRASGRQGVQPAPYGWRWDDRGQQLQPDPAERRALRYIQKLRAFGYTLQELADQLERDGLPPRQGGRWRKGELFDLLDRIVPERQYARG